MFTTSMCHAGLVHYFVELRMNDIYHCTVEFSHFVFTVVNLNAMILYTINKYKMAQHIIVCV